MNSLCLQFDQFGAPAEQIQCKPQAMPDPEPGEVRVRMRYAPINPADLNVIEGTYGRKPHLPCIPGHEGSGEVEAVGSDVTSLDVGDQVVPLLGAGCWAQHMVAGEGFFARVPASMDPVQASMLRINPVTAWLLLRDFVDLDEGDWVVQNAANSAVGQALIQIAAKRGIRTMNFVRRNDLVAPLKELGATQVLVDDEEGHTQAAAQLQGTELRFGINAVSGDSAIRMMNLLSESATMVTYGAMSRRSLKVPNRFVIFKDLTLRGLWVTRWLEHATPDALFGVLEPLAEMMLDGELKLPVDRVLPMSQPGEALLRASESGRDGKVVLDLSA